MKRYLLFAGSVYYPDGGWDDFKDSFDTREQAIEECNQWKGRYGWAHVIDAQTGEKLAEV